MIDAFPTYLAFTCTLSLVDSGISILSCWFPGRPVDILSLFMGHDDLFIQQELRYIIVTVLQSLATASARLLVDS